MHTCRALTRVGVLAGSVIGASYLLNNRYSTATQSFAIIPAYADARKEFHTIDERTAQLKLVQVVFRHGARTPLTKRRELWQQTGAQWDVCNCAYDTVPLQLFTADGQPASENPGNLKQVSQVYEGGCHMGQLTEVGQLQAKDFGTWLRKRYVDRFGLLPQEYQEGILSARTTNFQRTIATLAGVITGLVGGPNVKPIPTVTSSDLDEILYADSKSCPHLALFMKMGKEAAQSLTKSDPDYEWVCEELLRLGYIQPGQQSPSAWFFADMHDAATSLAAANKPLPKGWSPRLIKALNRLATKEFAPLVAPSIRDAHGHAVLKLSMGVLLSTIVKNMEDAAGALPATASSTTPANASTSTKASTAAPPSAATRAVSTQSAAASVVESTPSTVPRMYLYSGHDSTVMPILAALGLDTLSSWPPYLSNVVFELWQLPVSEGGHHVVRVMYNRDELDIPHCPSGQYATLDVFKSEVIGSFLISQQDLSEACKVPVQHDTSQPKVSLSAPSDEDDDSSP